MPIIFKSTPVILSSQLKTQIELAAILAFFESIQKDHLDFARRYYFNPRVIQEPDAKSKYLFFGSPISFIVQQAKPNGHFYWFKKIYAYYQLPSNKDVYLDVAIQELLNSHIQPMEKAHAKIQALCSSQKPDGSPLVKKLEKDQNTLFKKLEHLRKKMPHELMHLAKNLGTKKIQSLYCDNILNDNAAAGSKHCSP